MQTSAAGRAYIESQEGLTLHPIWDEKAYSWGYGHTRADVPASGTITPQEADALLSQDLADTEAIINNSPIVDSLNQDQYDALVDFGHSGSEYLRHVLNLMEQNDTEGAKTYIKSITHVKRDGVWVSLPNLETRRNHELAALDLDNWDPSKKKFSALPI
jgi:GH24 family phage-related lysozyme (muramidase)